MQLTVTFFNYNPAKNMKGITILVGSYPRYPKIAI